MRLELVTPPDGAPITNEEARALLGLSLSVVSEDVLTTLLVAAGSRLDGANGYLGRALLTQTWDVILDNWTGTYCPEPRVAHGDIVGGTSNYPHHHHRGIRIPLPPLRSVESVTYLDYSGETVTIDPDDYTVMPGDPGYVRLKDGSWPEAMLRIRFVAGYGDTPDDVPAMIRTATVLHAAALRSSISADPNLKSEMTFGVDSVTYAGPGAAVAKAKEANDLVADFRVLSGVA